MRFIVIGICFLSSESYIILNSGGMKFAIRSLNFSPRLLETTTQRQLFPERFLPFWESIILGCPRIAQSMQLTRVAENGCRLCWIA